MGAAPSRRVPDPEPEPPKRKRAPRTKKNKAVQTNTADSDNNNDNNNNTNTNIKGSPSIQLKRIVDLICDKKAEHEQMNLEDTTKLLKQIRRLSFTKKET